MQNGLHLARRGDTGKRLSYSSHAAMPGYAARRVCAAGPLRAAILSATVVAKATVDSARPVEAGGEYPRVTASAAAVSRPPPSVPPTGVLIGDAVRIAVPVVVGAALVRIAATSMAPPEPDVLRLLEAAGTDPLIWVSAGLALGAFVQTLTGFGFAMFSVGALSELDWIAHSSFFETVQPIAATLSCGIAWTLVRPEIRLVEWWKVYSAIVSSALFTPVGAIALEYIKAGIVLLGLGAFIASYVVFTARKLRVKAFLVVNPTHG
jgi:hypothetical protein